MRVQLVSDDLGGGFLPSSRRRDKNPRTGVLLCDLTGFCGYLFAQGYPCQIAHGIVCPGLKGPAAESLLFPERIVSTAFG